MAHHRTTRTTSNPLWYTSRTLGRPRFHHGTHQDHSGDLGSSKAHIMITRATPNTVIAQLRTTLTTSDLPRYTSGPLRLPRIRQGTPQDRSDDLEFSKTPLRITRTTSNSSRHPSGPFWQSRILQGTPQDRPDDLESIKARLGNILAISNPPRHTSGSYRQPRIHQGTLQDHSDDLEAIKAHLRIIQTTSIHQVTPREHSDLIIASNRLCFLSCMTSDDKSFCQLFTIFLLCFCVQPFNQCHFRVLSQVKKKRKEKQERKRQADQQKEEGGEYSVSLFR